MSINIPESILELKGQRVNTIDCNEHTNSITISCCRNRRFTPIDPATHSPGTIIDIGIVKEITGKSRNKIYAYQNYLDILSLGTEPFVF